MGRYVCKICGYVYDEATEKPFSELPDDWKCPLCGAPKAMFEKLADGTGTEEGIPARVEKAVAPVINTAPEEAEAGTNEVLRQLTAGELAALFSSLAKGCEKQYLQKEAELYNDLSEYFTDKAEVPCKAELGELIEKINGSLSAEHPAARLEAEGAGDRGALRALVWSEKVTRIAGAVLERYEREGDAMLENTKIWVCDICGFIYIGDSAPDICPVCKAPGFKIREVR